jgi:hypothetical protein
MTDDLLVRAYRASNRRMWIVYRQAGRVFGDYRRGEDSTRELARRLGVSTESIANWAKAGWLREALRGMTYTDETGRAWTFYDLRRALTLAHFQIAGKALHREDIGPEGAFEWLAIAACDGMSAEKMAAEILPSGPQFVARFSRLLRTPLPSDWEGDKRNSFLTWLRHGRELQTTLEDSERTAYEHELAV